METIKAVAWGIYFDNDEPNVKSPITLPTTPPTHTHTHSQIPPLHTDIVLLRPKQYCLNDFAKNVVLD